MTRRGRPRHEDVLTPAEWRIAELVRHGLSTGRIAALLGISRDGVKYHARNAVEKLGLPGRQALRQYCGVQKGSAYNRRRKPAMIELSHLGQISRQVENLDRAFKFYRDRLGLKELFAFPPLAFFDLGGTRLMLRETNQRTSADILYFTVPDIGLAHETLAAHGVIFSGAPHMIHRHDDGTEEWMAFFQDDEARDLALHMIARP